MTTTQYKPRSIPTPNNNDPEKTPGHVKTTVMRTWLGAKALPRAARRRLIQAKDMTWTGVQFIWEGLKNLGPLFIVLAGVAVTAVLAGLVITLTVGFMQYLWLTYPALFLVIVTLGLLEVFFGGAIYIASRSNVREAHVLA